MPETNDSVYVAPTGVPFRLIRYLDDWVVMEHCEEGWRWLEPVDSFLNRWRCA